MRLHHMLLAATTLALTAPATAGPAEDFKALTDEYWAFVLKENPTYASQLGHHEYDGELTDISLAAEDRRATQAERYLARLNGIPDNGLSSADQVNKSILKRNLEEAIEGNRFGQRMMLFTNREGWHQNFAGLSENLTFRNKADYENYLKRLEKYPAFNDEALSVSTQALKGGFVLPCVAMGGFEKLNQRSGPRRPDPIATLWTIQGEQAGNDQRGGLVRTPGSGPHADRWSGSRCLCQALRLVHQTICACLCQGARRFRAAQRPRLL